MGDTAKIQELPRIVARLRQVVNQQHGQMSQRSEELDRLRSLVSLGGSRPERCARCDKHLLDLRMLVVQVRSVCAAAFRYTHSDNDWPIASVGHQELLIEVKGALRS